MRSSSMLLAMCLGAALAQGPGNGVSKTTYASENPFDGLAFNLKYYPMTAAYDSGHGNVQFGTTIQGRAQLTKANQYSERNCNLFSAAAGATAKTGSTNMAAPAALGNDCTYTTGHAFDTASSTLMWAVYAYNADICCKACAATKGCTATTYNKQTQFFDATPPANRTVGMPMPFEGFGMHLVNVQSSKTTGGITVGALEKHFTAR